MIQNKSTLTEPPILSIQGVSKSYGNSSKVSEEQLVLKNISLDLYKQETLAVVGESGCGKTTLIKCMMKIETYHQGKIFLYNEDIQNLKQKNLARKVQMVFQDPHSSLNPRKTVFQIVSEPLQIFGETTGLSDKVTKALSDVGLDEKQAQKYPHMLSGGQKQRVAIARALIFRPEILVCDEPVSALDVSVQAQVLNLLKDLQQKYSLSLIFVSHDLSVVRFIANRVAVLQFGKIVELADKDQLFNSPEHPYTQKLLRAAPLFERT
ncbi:MAG: ABC transporter ATP-binding protein [Pseudobdellovibrionaceae bacterium]